MPELDSLVSAVAHPSQESSTPLASFLGSIYGDDPKADETTEPRASEDTPSSSTATDASDVNSDPSDVADAAADTPSAEPSAPEPAAAEPTEPVEDDPLAGSSPLTYRVNGQDRTYEGITRLKDGGAIVDPEKVEDLVRKLGERDHLYEKSRDDYQSRQAFETHYHTLTAWQTRDATGKTVTLTGADGLMAQRELLASSLAAQKVLTEAIRDPETLLNLLAQDSSGNVVLNPQGAKYLDALLKAETTTASTRARQAFGQLAAQHPVTQVQTQAPVAVNIEASAMPTVEKMVSDLGIQGLSPEDKQFFASQLPRYVRDSTPEEQQIGHGPKTVDYGFRQMLEREARLRADASKQVTSATTTASTVAQRNASRLAAASVGKKPNGKPSPRPSPTPERTKDDELDDYYLKQEAILAGALRGS